MSKDYNKRRDNNPSQIAKEYGRNVFIEVIQPNDNFERVTINLVALNPNNTQKCMISTFVDMDDFITLCRRIVCGRFGQMLERGKQIAAANSNGFPQEIWKRQGGKEGPNGAWMLSIHPATKGGDCLIKARRGRGEKMDNGLVKLCYSSNDDQVMISLTHEILENIANMSLMRIQAYIVSRQIRGLYDYVPRTNKGEPEHPQQGFTEQPYSPYNQNPQAADSPYGQYGGPVDYV